MSQLSQFVASGSTTDACVGPQSKVANTATSLRPRWKEKCAELVDTGKIAIVDDEEMNIEVVQGYLEQEGYQNFFFGPRTPRKPST